MNGQNRIERAALLLAEARQSVSVIDSIPEDIRPNSLAEAYAVQDRLIEILGAETKGYFGDCINDVIQRTLGLNEPYYAYLIKITFIKAH